MKFHPQHAEILLKFTQSILGSDEPPETQIRHLWINIAHLKAMALAQLLGNTIGNAVYAGPFKGMKLTPAAMSGIFGPYLTGSYEHELHASFEKIITTPYQTILNIGCAFGYYATGLALRMLNTTVRAFDISEVEQQRCRDMAALNQVDNRVKVSGLFEGGDFANYAGQKTFVLMDIEGGEKTLLDPVLYPALQKMDILVELHDVLDSTLSKAITDRFAATHDITFITNSATLFDFSPFTGTAYVDPFESLIINWENRDGPTPWAVMTAK